MNKPILCAAALLSPLANVATPNTAAAIQPLDSGWEFHQGALGSLWEIWCGNKATDNVIWSPAKEPVVILQGETSSESGVHGKGNGVHWQRPGST